MEEDEAESSTIEKVAPSDEDESAEIVGVINPQAEKEKEDSSIEIEVDLPKKVSPQEKLSLKKYPKLSSPKKAKKQMITSDKKVARTTAQEIPLPTDLRYIAPPKT